ncbi:SubName: Full=Related to MNR2-Manganese resistance protein {ECO:0000313/EMBL:CCA67453.1} [Serendipita indica DSM 11827]|nr:SubName: Full=Related to MNR2-Manganese resistance protein {ECO:0000313/EMBL:CCA67453.1} [Serendipita indica DSM 11827]
MENQFVSSPITLTNLLVGSPPRTLGHDESLHDQHAQQADQIIDEDDIYRGPDPRSPHLTSPNTQHAGQTASSISSSSSSSSSSSGIGFNIIPSVIERSITRWARGRGLRRRGSISSSSSSSSNSDTTSTNSSNTSHRQKRKKRRRHSPSSIYSHATSLTTRRQMRAASRALPREFMLFLPSHLSSGQPKTGQLEEKKNGIEVRTTSLNPGHHVLQQDVSGGSTPRADVVPLPGQTSERKRKKDNGLHVAFDIPSDHLGDVTPKGGPGARKGRGRPREVARQFFLQEPKGGIPADLTPSSFQPSWWLEVASPTWDDMRALGKLLQLHPLTLEDILQKESREKFELFPRLGYYFIVFRAIERPKPGLVHQTDFNASMDDLPELTEVLEVTNVYLVVFREGICIFHFEDISIHMSSIRKRIQQLQYEGTLPMGSDWVAHGVMDSIVDAFFPVLNEIEKEVERVEELVTGLDEQKDTEHLAIDSPEGGSSETALNGESNASPDAEKKGSSPDLVEEKDATRHIKLSARSRRRGMWKQVRRVLVWCWQRIRRKKTLEDSTLARDMRRLRRMTATRRLVTTLGRLLSSKYEVVAQVRKRLAGQEVSIYMGDVQDHIITLLQSLSHYEHLLSHSHPAYLSHLRMSLSDAKGGLDEALLLLGLVSLLVLCSQSIASIGGMNVHVPRSADYSAFGVFVSVAVTLSMISLGLARYWFVKAHGKASRMEEL